LALACDCFQVTHLLACCLAGLHQVVPMDAPCCVGVVRDSSGLVGSDITVGKKLKAYYAAPKVKTGKRMGIVVVHDIFGTGIPNCKYIVDHLASKGFDAVMPDFYAEKDLDPVCWPASETEILKELGTPDFQEWFGKITSEDFWGKFKKDVDEATQFLRRKGCIRYGVVGFCWGGLAAEMAGKSGRFSATVSLHGCAHSADSYKEVKGKSLYVSIPDDGFFPKESQDAIIAAGGKVKIMEGMTHGFVVRGDYSNAKTKSAADEAMADTVDLFSAACLRAPRMNKVGSINPGSKGVTCLVKVLGAPVEVEEPSKKFGTTKFYEVTCGDETGQVILSLKDFQKEGIETDKILCVRNAAVRMVKGYIRLVVDKWGKLDLSAEGTIDEIGDKNISKTEYELVQDS